MLNNLYKYMSISGIVNLEDSVLGNPQNTGEKKIIIIIIIIIIIMYF